MKRKKELTPEERHDRAIEALNREGKTKGFYKKAYKVIKSIFRI